MSKVRLFGALLTLATVAMLSLPTLAGNDKKGDKDKPRPKETDTAKMVQTIALANQLIDYGIANKSPAALLTAAEILHNCPIKDDPKRVIKTEGVEKPKDTSKDRTAQNVLALAKKLAKDLKVEGFDALAAGTEKKLEQEPRSPYPQGQVVQRGHLHGGERASYWIHCHGHTHATVSPRFPHHHVDLDIFVYNSAGQLVAQDRSTNPTARVHFDGDGDFRIEVLMYTPNGHCDYVLIVN